ncbi:hypothetical protein G6F51_014714 [Rhizopus arrhizus]|uniref:Uncharacterized protein n=1 Tax=Rhizopus oryzae TaxID=64495 RepID=A0A9P6XL15_RHIOR|nr:hypothetical protein G6F51_014714 [Rhizopus arrhizus]
MQTVLVLLMVPGQKIAMEMVEPMVVLEVEPVMVGTALPVQPEGAGGESGGGSRPPRARRDDDWDCSG